jgi:hypothetical protein
VGFSWALGQGWVVLGSGSEDLFRRETQNRFSSHFEPPETKNQKLMRKFKLVQGWPKNGAQIRKSQNAEHEKLSKSPNFDRILTLKSGRSAEKQGPFKIPGLDQFGLLIQL